MCNNGIGPVIPNDSVEVIEQKVNEASEKKVDCSQCLDIPHAFCLAEPQKDSFRMEFDAMIEKMTQHRVCSCTEGYLPIYDLNNGALLRLECTLEIIRNQKVFSAIILNTI